MNTDVEGGWDYLIVDESTQRLFVSHGAVRQVVDIKSWVLLSTIADTKGVHEIVIANDLIKEKILELEDFIHINNITINIDSEKGIIMEINPMLVNALIIICLTTPSSIIQLTMVLFFKTSKHVFSFQNTGHEYKRERFICFREFPRNLHLIL